MRMVAACEDAMQYDRHQGDIQIGKASPTLSRLDRSPVGGRSAHAALETQAGQITHHIIVGLLLFLLLFLILILVLTFILILVFVVNNFC